MPLNDNHMKYLLSVSLKNCPNLKSIDVITRDTTGETRERYDKLFRPYPDYRFRNATVEEYFDFMFSTYTQSGRRSGSPPFNQYFGSVLVENSYEWHFQSNAKAMEDDHALFMRLDGE